MKVRELFEDRGKPLTTTEFDHLQAPNPKNVKDRYRVGSIAFDNVDGLGAVPYNQEVDYMGFAAMMTPAMFLKFARPGDRSEDAEKLAGMMRKRVAIGAPFLKIKLNLKEFEQGEPLLVEVIGHEGRARMTAIQMIDGGKEKVPVHFFPYGGLRAHSLNEKFFDALRARGMVPEDLNISPLKVEMGDIFWMGKTV